MHLCYFRHFYSNLRSKWNANCIKIRIIPQGTSGSKEFFILLVLFLLLFLSPRSFLDVQILYLIFEMQLNFLIYTNDLKPAIPAVGFKGMLHPEI